LNYQTALAWLLLALVPAVSRQPAPELARQELTGLQETLQAVHSGSAASASAINSTGTDSAGGQGQAPGWSSPAIIVSNPDGIAAVTPADQVWVSGTETTVSADNELHWLSQGETVLSVAGGIALYTQGSDAPGGKPNQETGIALHAAQGPVSARAHNNLARVAAQVSVTIASTQADVSVAASKHILASAAGAYLRMEGGNIELGAPGTIEFKASRKEWTGPKNNSPTRIALPGSTEILNWIALHYLDAETGEVIDGAEYEIHFKAGGMLTGKLGTAGKARHDGIENKPVEKVIYKPRPGDPERPPAPLEDLLMVEARGSAA